MKLLLCCLTFVFLATLIHAKKPKTEEDCEVCVNVLRQFDAKFPDVKDKTEDEIKEAFYKFCKTAKDRDERFCYYIGGLETSATNIVGKLVQPFKSHFPFLKICDRLNSLDSQICELKYEKKIDLTQVDFQKLKVKDLKKILSDWNEDKACKGCSEKSDFVGAVKELMPKHAPEAYKKLKERDEL